MFEEYQSELNNEAKKWRVNPGIHKEDFIFHFLFNHPSKFKSKEEAIEYYFSDGNNSARQLCEMLKTVCGYSDRQRIEILEFASGYGCVTRHLQNEIPFAGITACDIHQEAVDFVERKLGTPSVVSVSQPERLMLEKKYDVVFALSFFSHMPKSTFTRWLRSLSLLLKPGGFLIFTTHGVQSMPRLGNVEFDENGFYFRENSEQKDLDTAEYGLSCTMPHYVLSQIFENQNSSLVYYREGYWWKHQDLYIVKHLEFPYNLHGGYVNPQEKPNITVNGKTVNFFRRIRNKIRSLNKKTE